MPYREKFGQMPSFDGFKVDVTDPEEYDSADSPDGTVFQKRIGIKKYILKSPDAATRDLWRAEIDVVLDAVKTHDVEKIKQVIKYPYILEHWDEIFVNLGKDYEAPLTEEEQTLLAISLWSMDKQGKWQGLVKAGKMIFSGGEHSLQEIVNQEIASACVNSASLVEYLTEVYGIKGLIKRTGGRGSHRYWESDSGRVVDTWWGREQGGLFRSFVDYMESRNLHHDVIQMSKGLSG